MRCTIVWMDPMRLSGRTEQPSAVTISNTYVPGGISGEKSEVDGTISTLEVSMFTVPPIGRISRELVIRLEIS